VDFGAYEALTFDCYGTLLDWEAGLLAALGSALGVAADDALLERFARHEARLEAGPYLPYRQVLVQAAAGVGEELGLEPSASALDVFGGSVVDWPAFPDSAAALASLAARFRLGVITNCDDDLFAASAAKLGNPFSWVVTAQHARAYRPSLRPFELAFSVMDVPQPRILHVAQSLFHDHVPAKSLGLRTVWVDRRAGRAGSGATPAASAAPDLRVTSMAELAGLAGRAGIAGIAGG
jgi:2-haloacid dehalogenase